MACSAVPLAPEMLPKERLEVLFEELAELTGQRNAIDARIVDIVAEMEHDNLCGMTGAASIPALVAWKTGTSRRNADRIAAIAHRLEEFPRCTTAMREGRLSLDQVGTIAERAAHGSDQHYAEMAASATVISGDANEIAVASANGSRCNAEKLVYMPPTLSAPRPSCPNTRVVRTASMNSPRNA